MGTAVDYLAYLDFFDVVAVTAAFEVSAGLFEPAWSFSLNDETCFKIYDDYCVFLSGGYFQTSSLYSRIHAHLYGYAPLSFFPCTTTHPLLGTMVKIVKRTCMNCHSCCFTEHPWIKFLSLSWSYTIEICLTLTISVFPYFSNETVHVVRSSEMLSTVAS